MQPDTRGAKTLREQLALHRSKGSCAACHAKFDPYGFALESFDVTGAYRVNYRRINPDAVPAGKTKGGIAWCDGLPVDCTGQTPDGRSFTDIRELRRMLAENPAQLARGFARHFVTYATGAPASRLDQPAIEAIVQSTAKSMVLAPTALLGSCGGVQSELFQWK